MGRKREGEEVPGSTASECGYAPDDPRRNSEFNKETHFTVPYMEQMSVSEQLSRCSFSPTTVFLKQMFYCDCSKNLNTKLNEMYSSPERKFYTVNLNEPVHK